MEIQSGEKNFEDYDFEIKYFKVDLLDSLKDSLNPKELQIIK